MSEGTDKASSSTFHENSEKITGHSQQGNGNDGISEGSSGDGLGEGMDIQGFSGLHGPNALTPEALAKFNLAQNRAGIVYLSRIPPGMQPPKVRHLMSAYGEVGRIYLQQEDAKRAYFRRKHTNTKKPHFIEGWVEFMDKQVARSVAEMLNAQPIGGKKGSRWRDDVWTMKYLPKFKWNMLTEQIAHEAAVHAAKLRVELAQSKVEQSDYLKNVELARVLDKRAERRRQAGKEPIERPHLETRRNSAEDGTQPVRKKQRVGYSEAKELDQVLGSIF